MFGRRITKRSLDLAVSIVALALLAPFLLAIAGTCLLFQGRPIVHVSVRAGRRSKPFRLYKFRTMSNDVDGTGQLRPDEERMTRVGRVLRATSLDELPQLLNIARGEMSLVGPRPLPIAYIGRYSEYESRRLRMRPGLTGLAQVRGRNSISWQQKFAYDIAYVERWSWRLEVRIIVSTFAVVLGRHGVSSSEQATMHEFRGTTKQKLATPGTAAVRIAGPSARPRARMIPPPLPSDMLEEMASSLEVRAS